MINKKIAGIASFAGVALNNVKAADTNVYVNIGGTIYSEASNGKVQKANLSSLDGLISELAKLTNANVLKKDGTSNTETLNLKDILKEYFVKSVKVGSVEKLTKEILADLTGETISTNDNNKLVVELVKKEDRINITYDDTAVKGARLTKAKEKDILGFIIQGKNNKSILDGAGISNLEFNFVNKTQTEETELIGKEVDLFTGEAKLEFKILKFTDGYKTVVCKFSDDTESKLVKGVDLEKLCTASNITTENNELSAEVTALNAVPVDNVNSKLFKDGVTLNILPDGDSGKILAEGTKKIPSACKFIVVNDIKKEDINPIFLKKSFTVEFDNEGNNTKKVNDDILKKIKDELNKAFEDTVVIKVSDITTKILGVQEATPNDIILANAFTNLSAISIVGVKNSTPNTLDVNDIVDASEIKIKLKSAAFNAKQIKTTINLTLTNIGEQKRDDKELDPAVATKISDIIAGIKEVLLKSEFVSKFNDSGSGIELGEGKTFDENDFDFSQVATGNNIDKSAAITLTTSFWTKLNDKCYKTKEEIKESETEKLKGEGDNAGDGTNGSGSSDDTKNKSTKYSDYKGK